MNQRELNCMKHLFVTSTGCPYCEIKKLQDKCESLEQSWKVASSCCNKVAGERDLYKKSNARLIDHLEFMYAKMGHEDYKEMVDAVINGIHK